MLTFNLIFLLFDVVYHTNWLQKKKFWLAVSMEQPEWADPGQDNFYLCISFRCVSILVQFAYVLYKFCIDCHVRQ